jgi:hypothetical protein
LEFVLILRALWAHRLAVMVGAVLSMALAVFTAFGLTLGPVRAPGGQEVFGTAVMKVLLDTPDSQLVTANPKAADSLGVRAALLGDRLALDSSRAAIARKAGLRPDAVDVLGPSAWALPPVETPLSRRAAPLSILSDAQYIVGVHADSVLPFVTLETRAPTAGGAAKLAEAAAAELTTLVTADPHAYTADNMSEPATETIVVAQWRKVYSAGLAAVIFVLWCFGVVIVSGLVRRARRPVAAAQPA